MQQLLQRANLGTKKLQSRYRRAVRADSSSYSITKWRQRQENQRVRQNLADHPLEFRMLQLGDFGVDGHRDDGWGTTRNTNLQLQDTGKETGVPFPHAF